MDSTPRYRYCATNRPIGFATVPAGYVAVEARPATGDGRALARHGVVVYDRRLSDQETAGFELAPILSETEICALAGEIAEECAEYREGIEEMLEDLPQEAARSILQRVEWRFPGVVCLGEREEFVERVLAAMGITSKGSLSAVDGGATQ